MSFRIKGTLFVLIILSLLQASCSRFFNGNKNKDEVIELSSDKFSCLQKVPLHMNFYLKGIVQDQEISDSVKCISDSMNYFISKTRGTNKESYSAEEIRTFFGKYFLKENNISLNFAKEIMKFKKALLGGTTDVITKKEIENFVKLLKASESELIKLKIYIAIYFFKDVDFKGQDKDKFIDDAFAQMNESLKNIVRYTELSNSNYGFNDAKLLIEGLNQFIQGDQVFSAYADGKIWYPLVRDLKIILFGTDSVIHGDYEWNKAIDIVTSLLDISARFKYKVIGKIENRPDFYTDVFSILDKSLEVIKNSYRMRHSGEILFQDIDEFLDRLYEYKLLKLNLKQENLKKAYQLILVNFMNSNKLDDHRASRGLTKSTLNVVEFEINNWKYGQKRINKAFYEEQGEMEQLLLKKQLDESKNMISLNELSDDQIDRSLFEQNFSKFLDIFEVKNGIKYKKNGFVTFGKNVDSEWNWSNVTKSHWIYILSRLLQLSYGGKNGLQEQGLVRWYTEFQSIGLDLKIFDPRSVNPGKRSFFEANSFTLHGNGDEFMDLNETYDLLSVLFSAGIRSIETVDLLMKECLLDEVDIFEKRKYDENCFEGVFIQQMPSLFENLSAFSSYLERRSPQERKLFYKYLMNAGRVSDSNKNIVESADIKTLFVLSHYLETLFQVYDHDQNGILNVDEMEEASLRFIKFLKDLNPQIDSESKATYVFEYLLVYGEKPSTGFWSSKKDYLSFKVNQKSGQLPHVGRMSVARVLSVIKDEMKKKK